MDEGWHHFKSMAAYYSVTPRLDHYGCMVDLFGRAGQLKEAEDLLTSMPFDPSIVVWTSLLSHCRTHGNVDIGRRCFDNSIALNPREASAYVLMTNIYADAGMWDEVAKIQEVKISADAWKKPGKAFVEVDKKGHCIIVGDTNHPRINEIHSVLDNLSLRMKEEGLLPVWT